MYEIIKELEQRSDQTFQFREGTLYPVLHKLENNGYVKSYLSKGEKQFAEEKEQWQTYARAVNKVIGGNAHAFA